MDNEKVVAILWTLAAVSLVLLFAALVTQHRDDQQWSHVVVPTTKAPAYRLGGK